MPLPTDARLPQRLDRYVELLLQWNRAYNLTAITDPAEIRSKHLADSLSVLPHVHCRRLVDVGTGAGLPGLLLAAAGACESALLIDSAGKKVRFVKAAAVELGLAGVEARHARVEQVPAADGGEVVISRAYASLSDFIGSAGHLCLPGGRMLAMKGRVPEAELAALPAGWGVRAVYPLRVPGLDAERCLVELVRAG
ncbi:MAG: 16S rRNA (guanine(527)-N(7))-methyltransferase RsmG [Xanthomonadales bacterium]|jgi:16S rRNA (guanine527-N7)-methyltransferase|nr:16S rRNA (guanine(527)-N(7))-methyltransferase RsmG [Xanthomonadales bacterium]